MQRFPRPPLPWKTSTTEASGCTPIRPSADLAGERRAALGGGGDVDGRWTGRPGRQGEVLDPPVFAAVVDGVARHQPPDDVDALAHAVEPFAGAGPAPPERLLVESLAGSDAEEEATFEHDRRRGRRLGDGDRMRPVDHRRHAGSHLDRVGGVGDRADRGPDVARLALPARPRLQVIADHRRLEAGGLGRRRVLHERRGSCSSLDSHQPRRNRERLAASGIGTSAEAIRSSRARPTHRRRWSRARGRGRPWRAGVRPRRRAGRAGSSRAPGS